MRRGTGWAQLLGLMPLLALRCDCSTYGLGVASEQGGTSTSDALTSTGVETVGPGSTAAAGSTTTSAEDTSAGSELSGASSTTMAVCDLVPACHRWVHEIGDVAVVDTDAYVAFDETGHVILAGSFAGTVDFGKGDMTSVAERDIFIARYNPEGALQWVNVFNTGKTNEYTRIRGVAAGPGGTIHVVGLTTYDIDLGNGTINVSGSSDMLVAQYSPTGAALWSRLIGQIGAEEGWHIALDGQQSVLAAGTFSGGNVDLGGGTRVLTGAQDAFVLKLDTTGGYQWDRHIGGVADQVIRGMRVDQSDAVVVGGNFELALELDGNSLMSNSGWSDPFLLKMSSEGTHQWSKHLASAVDNPRYLTGLAIGPNDSVVLAGWFAGSLGLGGVVKLNAANYSPFVASLNRDGKPQWQHVFAIDAPTEISVTTVGLGVAGDGAVWLGTTVHEPIDLMGGVLVARGGDDLVLGKYDANGEHLWSGRFGAPEPQRFTDLAVDSAGDVVVAGTFLGSFDLLEGVNLNSVGPEPDIFVTRFGPCEICE